MVKAFEGHKPWNSHTHTHMLDGIVCVCGGSGCRGVGLANFYYYLFVLLVRLLQSKQYEIMLIFCSFHLKCLNVNQAASGGRLQGAGRDLQGKQSRH